MAIGWDNWGNLMCDAELFEPLVHRALAECGLPKTKIEAGFPGTNAVFRAGDAVVKLYAPLDILDGQAERCAYRAANGLPSIPKLLGEGVLADDGREWPYLVTAFARGRAVREVWDGMSGDERSRAACALGEWSRAYHALPDPFDAASPISAPGFERERDGMVARNAQKLSKHPAFVEAAVAHLPDLIRREAPVFLHADLTEDHLLIDGGDYAVIDLADSRMGFEAMEWICVWFGMTYRDPRAFRIFLEASGRNWDARARMDMMTCALLHGFGANVLIDWIGRTGLSAENIFPEV